MDRYDAAAVEAKWQKVWADTGAFEVANPEPGAEQARKSYVLEMLPYPSGTLHLGHLLVYTIGDVLTHFRRRNGMHVLRPMGYDAFGLPAENAAIREGGHPREIVAKNIEHIRWEFKRLGYAFDWSRELSTADPRYYRWTQWLFLKLLEAGLAYRKEAPVKWCPQDQVVLANEQVRDGHCEYCGAEVEARMMEQWFFRTTAYADELIDSLAELDWPERIVAMQRHWIGRSHGAEITFRIDELGIDIPVFTTRADTLFGATFFVLAPKSVSGRVVKTGTSSSSSSTLKVTSAPSERPIQFRCIVSTRSGQSSFAMSSSRRSEKSVILNIHCSRFRDSTSFPQRSQRPSITCSFASTVWSNGHHLTGAALR